MLEGLVIVAQLALGAPRPGADCTLPKLRDAQPLRKAVQEDGNLSIAIDAVATACFDAEGEWNAGITSGKPRKNALGPECRKAISSCELANSARTRSAAIHLVDALALADMDRPFGNSRYAQQREGPAALETAADKVSCKSQKRSELFSMAQRRSDLSKIHAQTLSDYARYRAWLELERQRCRDGLNAPNTSVDAEKDGVAGADGGTSPIAAPMSAERRAALAAPLAEKWRYFANEAQKTDADPDFREYFSASKEAKDCICPRPNAAALARSIENKEGGATGLMLMTADDAANTRCALCFLDAYAAWKARVTALCSQMNEKSEYELNRLEQSDDGTSIPRRCFDRARDARAALQKLTMPPPPKAGSGAAGSTGGRGTQGASGGYAGTGAGAQGSGVAGGYAGTGAQGGTGAGAPGSGSAAGGASGRTGPGAIAGTTPGGASGGYAGSGAGGAGGYAGAGSPGGAGTGGNMAGGARGNGSGSPGGTGAGSGSPGGTGGYAAGGAGSAGTGSPGGTGGYAAGGAGSAGSGSPGTGGYAPSGAGGPAGSGSPGGTGPGSYAAGGAGSSAGTGSPGGPSGGLTTVNGMTYYHPPPVATTSGPVVTGPTPAYRAPTGPGSPDKPAPQYDAFVPPQSYAPIPAREEGRMYVRLSMSSACIAELTPGPIQARNGDLILVPFGAPTMDVKSPCGGVAEIYYGKEPTPRFSETFGRNQPVSFVFKPQ